MKVTGLDAVYATVKDIDGMTTFYTGLLGAPPNDRWPDRLSEWTFEDGNAFGLYKTDQADGSSGMPMFAVADVRAAIKEAQSLGATFDEHEFTDTPVCHMAFGADPEGNQFILHMRKNQSN
ncbi:MAG: VOC family protein [Candidatus Baltobacteraceae bacterium]